MKDRIVYLNISYYLIDELIGMILRHHQQHLENNENLFYLSFKISEKKFFLNKIKYQEFNHTLASNKIG